MRKVLTLVAITIFAVACSTTGSITGTTGSVVDASTTDFAVHIQQASTPQVFRTQSDADVKFNLEIVNQTNEAYTIERVSLQSMGGASYSIPVSARRFDTRIAPGETKRLGFWATATVLSETARMPVTIRATIEAKSDSGAAREEVFSQNVNGRVILMATHAPHRGGNFAPNFDLGSMQGSLIGSTLEPGDFALRRP